jgi:glycosyltransferase involved in cell wall biosynthesis
MDETTRLLAASDVLVLPGTIGLAIVHAMAIGLPCIAPVQELNFPEATYLRDGENGLSLPDLDASLVAALVRLHHEPAWRRALGDGALRYARQQLAPERQVRGFVAAIEHAISVAGRREIPAAVPVSAASA